ncbi:hypothetical protein FPV67DRAFT_1443941 [Lyophyllum atratum]|nr:hypothetical protein FPV67DRAFT_1443941 [Lyophyllum atratum]
MTIITRIGVAFLLLFITLPIASSTSTRPRICDEDEFWLICLPGLLPTAVVCLTVGPVPLRLHPRRAALARPPLITGEKSRDVAYLVTLPLLRGLFPSAQQDGYGTMQFVDAILFLPPHDPIPLNLPTTMAMVITTTGPGGHWKKRSPQLKARSAPLCPTGLDACPISGAKGGDYECLDTATELESCGGCASFGDGKDCTAIPGAWNVGCDQGRCTVYTCAGGFKRSQDGKSCVTL